MKNLLAIFALLGSFTIANYAFAEDATDAGDKEDAKKSNWSIDAAVAVSSDDNFHRVEVADLSVVYEKNEWKDSNDSILGRVKLFMSLDGRALFLRNHLKNDPDFRDTVETMLKLGIAQQNQLDLSNIEGIEISEADINAAINQKLGTKSLIEGTLIRIGFQFDVTQKDHIIVGKAAPIYDISDDDFHFAIAQPLVRYERDYKNMKVYMQMSNDRLGRIENPSGIEDGYVNQLVARTDTNVLKYNVNAAEVGVQFDTFARFIVATGMRKQDSRYFLLSVSKEFDKVSFSNVAAYEKSKDYWTNRMTKTLSDDFIVEKELPRDFSFRAQEYVRKTSDPIAQQYNPNFRQTSFEIAKGLKGFFGFESEMSVKFIKTNGFGINAADVTGKSVEFEFHLSR